MRTERYGSLDVVLAGGTDRMGGGDGPLVVLMHGFGAPGDDLVGLWRVLDVPAATRFAFPAAPVDLGWQYAGGRAWWRLDPELFEEAARGVQRDRSREVPEGLAEARAAVEEMLSDMIARLAPPKVVLGGFSQGAMLALDVALRSDRPLDGLALLSSTLLAVDEWTPLMPRRAGTRALVSHGRQDPLLPFATGERLARMLGEAGWKVDFVPFNGGHEIPGAVLDALGRLITDATS